MNLEFMLSQCGTNVLAQNTVFNKVVLTSNNFICWHKPGWKLSTCHSKDPPFDGRLRKHMKKTWWNRSQMMFLSKTWWTFWVYTWLMSFCCNFLITQGGLYGTIWFGKLTTSIMLKARLTPDISHGLISDSRHRDIKIQIKIIGIIIRHGCPSHFTGVHIDSHLCYSVLL